MMMQQKPWYYQYLINALRKISRYENPEKKTALIRAMTREIGMYKCAECLKPFGRAEIQIDHIDHMIPLTGFDNWDGVINRLFCKADRLQVLCKPCHGTKTKSEAKVRRAERKIAKRKPDTE